MFKKTLIASVIALMTTGVALAYTAPYIGAGVGVLDNTQNVKVNGSTYSGGAYRGVPFNLFAGYGGLINQNIYLAGEVSGTLATANISDNTELKSTSSFSASIIPGLMLNDRTMAYARAGVVRTRYPNLDDTHTGGQFGLGLQTSLTQNVDLRGEYDFTAYQAKNFNDAGTTFSVAPRSDQFNIGLVYKFE